MGRDDLIAALAERGAATIDHPGGKLLAHLVRTADLLVDWGAGDDLVVAGLTHAAYGTDGFGVALFGLDEREALQELAGAASERIVYRYASCDRARTLRQIGAGTPVVLRDRFTGGDVPLDDDAVFELAELSVANELDLVRHSEQFRAEHGRAIAQLFAPWMPVVSPAAAAECRRLLGDLMTPAASE